jgi:DNA-binding MarR family transcriptional regulator
MSAQAPTRSPAAEAWDLLQGLMLDVQRPRFLTLCSEFDITPPQLMTLRRLDSDSPVPTSEVAKWLACDASNVTGIVDRLEARGLVERRAAPADRRVRMLALTEDGAALRDEISRRMAVPPDQLAALPHADQRALRDILRRALDRD